MIHQTPLSSCSVEGGSRDETNSVLASTHISAESTTPQWESLTRTLKSEGILFLKGPGSTAGVTGNPIRAYTDPGGSDPSPRKQSVFGISIPPMKITSSQDDI